jgi:hypothetical protein
MIDFNRKAAWVTSDVIWLGHKHNKLVDATPLRLRCPKNGAEPIVDQQVCIMTGAYMNNYAGSTHEHTMQHGRRSVYSSDAGLPPQGKGGVRLLVKVHRQGGVEHIRVVC